jgi:hypothetical protein
MKQSRQHEEKKQAEHKETFSVLFDLGSKLQFLRMEGLTSTIIEG